MKNLIQQFKSLFNNTVQEEKKKAELVRQQAELDRKAQEEKEKVELARQQAEFDRKAQEEKEKVELAHQQAELDRKAQEEKEKAELARQQAELDRKAQEEKEKAELARQQAELAWLKEAAIKSEQERKERIKREQEELVEKAKAEKIAKIKKEEQERIQIEHKQKEGLYLEAFLSNPTDPELIAIHSKILYDKINDFINRKVSARQVCSYLEDIVEAQKPVFRESEAGTKFIPMDKSDYYKKLQEEFSTPYTVFQVPITNSEELLKVYIRDNFNVFYLDDREFMNQSSYGWLIASNHSISASQRNYSENAKEVGKAIILLGMFTKYCCLKSQITLSYLP